MSVVHIVQMVFLVLIAGLVWTIKKSVQSILRSFAEKLAEDVVRKLSSKENERMLRLESAVGRLEGLLGRADTDKGAVSEN